MVVVDGQGIPLGSQLTTASPGEVTLVDSTLSTIKVPRPGRGRPRSNPERLIADTISCASGSRNAASTSSSRIVVTARVEAYRMAENLGAIAIAG